MMLYGSGYENIEVLCILDTMMYLYYSINILITTSIDCVTKVTKNEDEIQGMTNAQE